MAEIQPSREARHEHLPRNHPRVAVHSYSSERNGRAERGNHPTPAFARLAIQPRLHASRQARERHSIPRRTTRRFQASPLGRPLAVGRMTTDTGSNRDMRPTAKSLPAIKLGGTMNANYCHNCRHHSTLPDGTHCGYCLEFFYSHQGRLPTASDPVTPQDSLSKAYAELGWTRTS